MVSKLPFFTPVYYGPVEKNWKQKVGEAIDSVFDVNLAFRLGPMDVSLGTKRAFVVPRFHNKGAAVVSISEAPAEKQSVFKVALKVSLFIPALILKTCYRLLNPFYTSSAVDFVQQRQKNVQDIYSDALSNPSPVQTGYGEYAVFHASDSGRKEVSLATYQKVERLFLQFKKDLVAQCPEGQSFDELYARMRREVKKIDDSLDVQFVPKTLYELAFIRFYVENEIECKNSRHSWTLFPAFRPEKLNNQTFKEDAQIRYQKVAFELNNKLVGMLPQKSEDATFQWILAKVDEQVDALQKQCGKDSVLVKRKMQIENNWTRINDGVATSMQHPLTYNFTRDGWLATDEEKQMMHRALALECSSLGKEGVLLYRGGHLLADAPDNPNEQYGTSYGTSLFAGILYDKGATALTYCRFRDAYIYSIPYKKINGPFKTWKIPNDPALYQLAGAGEEFHARSRNLSSARFLVGGGGGTIDVGSKWYIPKDPQDSGIYPLSYKMV